MSRCPPMSSRAHTRGGPGEHRPARLGHTPGGRLSAVPPGTFISPRRGRVHAYMVRAGTGIGREFVRMHSMRMTFLGHVGFSVETGGGSVLCDPWFTPAYFGSWFPFPRNDGLDPTGFSSPDYLYISHLHRDHFDPEWLARHVDKRARVLLPAFDVSFLERELRAIGFEYFVRTRHGEPVDLDGLTVTLLAFTTPADGPPAFLDDDLVAMNDVDRDPANIFPDQTVFLEVLRGAGIDRGELVVPGSVVDLDAGECKVTHPGDEEETSRPFVGKRAYLEE